METLRFKGLIFLWVMQNKMIKIFYGETAVIEVMFE
jgi:hypothetical protein